MQKASEAEIIKKVDGIMESDADITAKQNYDIYLFFLRWIKIHGNSHFNYLWKVWKHLKSSGMLHFSPKVKNFNFRKNIKKIGK